MYVVYIFNARRTEPHLLGTSQDCLDVQRSLFFFLLTKNGKSAKLQKLGLWSLYIHVYSIVLKEGNSDR